MSRSDIVVHPPLELLLEEYRTAPGWHERPALEFACTLFGGMVRWNGSVEHLGLFGVAVRSNRGERNF
jgi:hypothetical protein